jgi:hypothetical protein
MPYAVALQFVHFGLKVEFSLTFSRIVGFWAKSAFLARDTQSTTVVLAIAYHYTLPYGCLPVSWFRIPPRRMKLPSMIPPSSTIPRI